MSTEHTLALARKAAYAASDALADLRATSDHLADSKARARVAVLASNTFLAWSKALEAHEIAISKRA